MKPLYAGLTEAEANETLCAWLNDRTSALRDAWVVSRGDDKLILHYRIGDVHSIDYFTTSHDSIHGLLDRMTEAEKSHYAWHLGALCASFRVAFATPRQKTTAALHALDLAKEADVSSL